MARESEPLPKFHSHLAPNMVTYFVGVLNKAQFHRDERPNITPDGTRGYTLYERQQMYFAVNEKRAQFQKAPVAVSEVTAIESYDSQKFAEGCVNLVLEIP